MSVHQKRNHTIAPKKREFCIHLEEEIALRIGGHATQKGMMPGKMIKELIYTGMEAIGI